MNQVSEFRLIRQLRFTPGTTDPLTKNPAHKFAAQHALEIFGARAIYTFIPKNGCSTLRYSLALANGVVRGPEDIDWIHKNNDTFQADLKSLATARYTFVVLRCPYRRLASVFLDKALKPGEKPFRMLQRNHEHHTSFVPRWRARAERRILRQRGRQQAYPDLTFRDFIARLTEPGGLTADHHWVPQSSFLIYNDYDDWFCLEAFGFAASKLQEQIGFEVKDARSLTGHGTDSASQVDDRCYADTPVQELLAMRDAGKVPAHASLFDNKLRAQVGQLYASDLELYRAQFGSEKLLFT